MAPLIRFIRQLGFVRLGSAAPKGSVDDDRVLHLFRNRAELKKAYGGLQDEVHRLKERIKQQEGATARKCLSGNGVLSAARALGARPRAADTVRRRARRTTGRARAARLLCRAQS